MIQDEGHHSTCATYEQWVECCKPKRVIRVSACLNGLASRPWYPHQAVQKIVFLRDEIWAMKMHLMKSLRIREIRSDFEFTGFNPSEGAEVGPKVKGKSESD